MLKKSFIILGWLFFIVFIMKWTGFFADETTEVQSLDKRESAKESSINEVQVETFSIEEPIITNETPVEDRIDLEESVEQEGEVEGLTPSEEDFLAFVISSTDEHNAATKKLGVLLQNPTFDERWKQEFVTVGQIIVSHEGQVRDVLVPERMKEVHREYMGAISYDKRGLELLMEGLVEFDDVSNMDSDAVADKFKQATEKFEASEIHMELALREMQKVRTQLE